MTARDRARLGASDQRLIDAVAKLSALMTAQGHPIMVTDGVRTTAQQILLYKQGREVPGPRVTNCDGVRVKSEHQRGRAADCCFLTPDGQPTWEGPWQLYGDTAEDCGLEWGGRWKKRPDKPHVQLPKDAVHV